MRRAPGLAAGLAVAFAVGTAAGFGLWLTACGGGPSPDTVATLGDHQIPYSAFAGFVEAQTDTSPASLEPPVLSSLLDQFLDERLLVRTAIDQGLLSPDAMGDDSDEHIDHRQALKALLDEAPSPEPTEAELRERYRAEHSRFTLPERVRLSQILVDDRATAEKAAAELDQGADFTEVAKRYSIDPERPLRRHPGRALPRRPAGGVRGDHLPSPAGGGQRHRRGRLRLPHLPGHRAPAGAHRPLRGGGAVVARPAPRRAGRRPRFPIGDGRPEPIHCAGL